MLCCSRISQSGVDIPGRQLVILWPLPLLVVVKMKDKATSATGHQGSNCSQLQPRTAPTARADRATQESQEGSRRCSRKRVQVGGDDALSLSTAPTRNETSQNAATEQINWRTCAHSSFSAEAQREHPSRNVVWLRPHGNARSTE